MQYQERRGSGPRTVRVYGSYAMASHELEQ
jgi:hypothetical protein